jgi:hypothetical protein
MTDHVTILFLTVGNVVLYLMSYQYAFNSAMHGPDQKATVQPKLRFTITAEFFGTPAFHCVHVDRDLGRYQNAGPKRLILWVLFRLQPWQITPHCAKLCPWLTLSALSGDTQACVCTSCFVIHGSHSFHQSARRLISRDRENSRSAISTPHTEGLGPPSQD